MLLFTCDVGFTLVGAVVRKCQANGTWSGTDALCQGEKKLSFMSKLNHHDSPLKHEPSLNLLFLVLNYFVRIIWFFYLVSLFLRLLFYFCCNFRCSDGTILINVSIVLRICVVVRATIVTCWGSAVVEIFRLSEKDTVRTLGNKEFSFFDIYFICPCKPQGFWLTF